MPAVISNAPRSLTNSFKKIDGFATSEFSRLVTILGTAAGHKLNRTQRKQVHEAVKVLTRDLSKLSTEEQQAVEPILEQLRERSLSLFAKKGTPASKFSAEQAKQIQDLVAELAAVSPRVAQILNSYQQRIINLSSGQEPNSSRRARAEALARPSRSATDIPSRLSA